MSETHQLPIGSEGSFDPSIFIFFFIIFFFIIIFFIAIRSCAAA